MPEPCRSEIASTISDYINGSDHPDLVVYRRDLNTNNSIYLWLKSRKRICDLAKFQNKYILEVGCGFGWDAVAISLLGNNRVLATDILPSMIDGARECLASSESKGNKINVKAMQADICSADLPENEFDAIFSSEAIEHVHDLDKMFRQCYRFLKPGGSVYIANDSNQYNSEFRKSTFEMWEERDKSWEHAEWLKEEVRPVEHGQAKPYAAMRAEIIQQSGLELDGDSLARLVEATAGMIRSEIIEAAMAYIATGKLPVRPKFAWCRNPETGEYAERLLDPFELHDLLKAAGFRNVRMRHAFNRFPLWMLNGISFRPLNEFLFNIRGMFILMAEK